MSGPNFNGKYSICSYEVEDDGETFHYTTVVSGYDTEEKAVSDLQRVAKEERMDPAYLAVVGAVFPAAF